MPTRLKYTALATLIASALLTACATQPKQAPAPTPSVKAAPAAPAAPAIAARPVRAPKDVAMTEILDDPKKLAVFRKHAPALADNPQIGMARGMSLADVAGYAEAGLTPQMVSGIVEDLSKL